MRYPFAYILFILTWVIISCDQPTALKAYDINAQAAQTKSIEKIISFQSPLAAIENDSLPIPLRNNTLYKAQIQQHVAKEALVTFQEMATKNGKIEAKIDPQLLIDVHSSMLLHVHSWQLRVQFQNDIFTNTDYYFTNGVGIAFTTPMAKRGFYGLLLGAGKDNQTEFTGFSITQNIYTPTNPDVNEVLTGDRPFSGYLTFGQFRETYNTKNKIIVKSRMEFGVLGPASFGDRVQSSIHQIEPVGWDNQIRNMPVINYFLTLEKGIFNHPNAELNLVGSIAAGTAFNSIEPGFCFRTGQFIPVLKGEASLHDQATLGHQWQYWLFVDVKSKMVIYDATLQGNMFNNNDPHVISTSEMNRIVPKLQAGLALYYQHFGVECSVFYLAPEFKQAKDFKWGSIRLVYQF